MKRKLKITIPILENQFFILKNTDSTEKDVLKHWDLQYTIFFLFLSKSITHYEFMENINFKNILLDSIAKPFNIKLTSSPPREIQQNKNVSKNCFL